MSTSPGFECPECGARLRGGRPGSVLACGACKNPVVVPEPRPERSRAPTAAADRPAAPFDAGRARRKLYRTAGIVLALVGVAHLGMYLLLTRDARANMIAIESRHDVAALDGAKPPEGEAKPGSAAYRGWRASKALWVDAEAWRNDRRQVLLLKRGIAGSFLVQVAITALDAKPEFPFV
ncbi:MAG: hypothetical protein P1V36_08765, partial [Planctomycetota bacterium]|nr:hypothetical protein [Planctomycetota bacterium]